MADPNDHQVSNPQGIRYPPSGASDSSEASSLLSTTRPGSLMSGLAEAPPSRAYDSSEAGSSVFTPRSESVMSSGLAVEAPSSRAYDSSEAGSSVFTSRPESVMSSGLAVEAPSSTVYDSSEAGSFTSRPESAMSLGQAVEAPSSRVYDSSEAGSSVFTSRLESAISSGLAEALIAAQGGAPRTELELSKLTLWKSELDGLNAELFNVHRKIEILTNRIIHEISHPVWNMSSREAK